jgi:TetR/AcrR family transcriptional repressor of nem operon
MSRRSSISAGSADTSARILEVAERLAQTRGFNGFSYADIALELRVTKASLHYHFATKADLGRTLIARYGERFAAALAVLDAEPDVRHRMTRYVQLYEDVLVADRMCLCGMLAAEYSTLPPAMQSELRAFFDRNESWLELTLDEGRTAASLHFAGTALEVARLLTSALEGAMLLARSYQEPERFRLTARRLLADIGVDRSASTRARRNSRDRSAQRARALAR